MRSSTFFAAAAALAARSTYAQLAGSEDGPNNGTDSGGTPTADDGNRTIHYVDVAKGGHFYQPNSIQAEVGDIVSFRFYPTNHSVIRSQYGYPCVPYEKMVAGGDGFFSGFVPIMEISDNPPTWNVTINSTEPVFYYCGAPGSCTDWGMVGAINANASTDVATQISLAKSADYMLLPGEPFPDEAMHSMSSMAATATAATVTATDPAATSASAIPDHPHESSGLSGGVIAGIVVGAVAALAILAALFFLLGRTKSMKKRIEDREQADRNSQMPPPAWMSAQQQQQQTPQQQHVQPYYNPHMSAQLPPYGHPDHGFYEQKPQGFDDSVSLASGRMSPPLRGQSPPVPEMGTHGMPGFQNAPNRESHGGYGFINQTSELDGTAAPAAELYTPAKDGSSPTATDRPAPLNYQTP